MSPANTDLSNLNLSKRVENVLRRAGVVSVVDLQTRFANGGLDQIRFVGPKAILEISSSLAAWHPQNKKRVAQGSTSNHSNFENGTGDNQSSIANEILMLLKPVNTRNFQLVIGRFSTKPMTLEALGISYGLTRERVRQIVQRHRKRVVERFRANMNRMPSIKHTYMLANDLDKKLTLANWERNVRTNAQIGQFSDVGLGSIDPFIALIAVTNMIVDEPWDSVIPLSLKRVLTTARSGHDSMSVEQIDLDELLTKAMRKLIKRHLQHSGAVNALWIAQRTQLSLEQTRQSLELLGYKQADETWHIPMSASVGISTNYHYVFQRGIRKMLQYCGPLSLDTLAAGLRRVNVRTQFPVPPPEILESVLLSNGFPIANELVYWHEELKEVLSEGEMIILSCLEKNGPVLHHAELAEAFIESDLSFASLHQTLKRSPIFDKIDYSLYKLRGHTVTYRDINRARNAASTIPQDADVQYDRGGNINVALNIGRIALGTGVIQTPRGSFPNLTGKWSCFVEGNFTCVMNVSKGEFRHIEKALREMGCKPGERVEFTFNTWDRTVALSGRGNSP